MLFRSVPQLHQPPGRCAFLEALLQRINVGALSSRPSQVAGSPVMEEMAGGVVGLFDVVEKDNLDPIAFYLFVPGSLVQILRVELYFSFLLWPSM